MYLFPMQKCVLPTPEGKRSIGHQQLMNNWTVMNIQPYLFLVSQK